jgi:hypothetical protein
VRGTDVRDNGLKGRDVRDETLTGNDVKEQTLGRVPAAASAETLGGKSASAFVGRDEVRRIGPVRLSAGQARTFATHGPFSWRAECSDEGGGVIRLKVTVESTEANSHTGAFGENGGGPVALAAPATLFDAT